jgi:hypothetical protein
LCRSASAVPTLFRCVVVSPYVTGAWRYARGLAFAATGRREDAARELAELETIRRGVPPERTLAGFFKTQDMLLLAAEALAGEIAARGGDTASAVRHFGEAVLSVSRTTDTVVVARASAMGWRDGSMPAPHSGDHGVDGLPYVGRRDRYAP